MNDEYVPDDLSIFLASCFFDEVPAEVVAFEERAAASASGEPRG
jgi:hypothetical protein